MATAKTTTETVIHLELSHTEAAALQIVLGSMSRSDYKAFLKQQDTSLTGVKLDRHAQLDQYAQHLGEIWSALKDS